MQQPLVPIQLKPARSYSSPKGAAAVKIKSSMAQKNWGSKYREPVFQISGGFHTTIDFK